jgi:hypothetical protein
MTVRTPATAVLERGDIHFAYRPRLDARTVRDLADVQRLYMIQSPHGKHAHRLIVIGAKRLPALSGRDDERRTWGFVETVAARAEDVEDELDPRTYRTQTRGERHVAPARPAGEAVYALVRHDEHTDRAVKNPETPSPPDAGLDETRRARFPKRLAERFAGVGSSPSTRPTSWTTTARRLCSSEAGPAPPRIWGSSFRRSRRRPPPRRSSVT